MRFLSATALLHWSRLRHASTTRSRSRIPTTPTSAMSTAHRERRDHYLAAVPEHVQRAACTGDDDLTQSITMSLESQSQLGNFGMGTRAAIPRNPIDNSIGNNVANGNFRDFDHLSRHCTSAANTIAALDRFIAAGNTTGSPARDARAKSFAYFALGYAT